jgi:hypothetical protein
MIPIVMKASYEVGDINLNVKHGTQIVEQTIDVVDSLLFRIFDTP